MTISQKRWLLDLALVLFIVSISCLPRNEAKAEEKINSGIKVSDWSFYAAWGMSTLHHVTIENSSDIAYKEIKVRINYYLSYYPTEPYTAVVTLPVVLSPHTKKTYLEDGLHSLILNPNGIYGMHLLVGEIHVVEAVPETSVGVKM